MQTPGRRTVNKISSVALAGLSKRFMLRLKTCRELHMKTRTRKKVEQPGPFTPGITKGMVRQHAYELFRDKLSTQPLTLEDWVLAEKDLVGDLEAQQTVG